MPSLLADEIEPLVSAISISVTQDAGKGAYDDIGRTLVNITAALAGREM